MPCVAVSSHASTASVHGMPRGFAFANRCCACAVLGLHFTVHTREGCSSRRGWLLNLNSCGGQGSFANGAPVMDGAPADSPRRRPGLMVTAIIRPEGSRHHPLVVSPTAGMNTREPRSRKPQCCRILAAFVWGLKCDRKRSDVTLDGTSHHRQRQHPQHHWQPLISNRAPPEFNLNKLRAWRIKGESESFR
jgi:hypothetical protein